MRTMTYTAQALQDNVQADEDEDMLRRYFLRISWQITTYPHDLYNDLRFLGCPCKAY